MGKYNVPHFDAKGEANAAFIDRGVPTTLLYTSFYWDNLVHFGMQPQRAADGNAGLRAADGQREAARDRRRRHRRLRVRHLRARRRNSIGKSIGIAGEHLSGRADGGATDTRARRAGAPHRADTGAVRGPRISGRRRPRQHVPVQDASSSASICASRSVDCTRELNPGAQTFAQWLAANASRIPIEQRAAA